MTPIILAAIMAATVTAEPPESRKVIVQSPDSIVIQDDWGFSLCFTGSGSVTSFGSGNTRLCNDWKPKPPIRNTYKPIGGKLVLVLSDTAVWVPPSEGGYEWKQKGGDTLGQDR